MLKIDLKENPKDGVPHLVVNGMIDKDSYFLKESDGLHIAQVCNQKVADQLTASRIRELERHFKSFTIPFEVEWNTDIDEVEVSFFDYYLNQGLKVKKSRKIKFTLKPDWEQWAKSYSIAEYVEAFERAVKNLPKSGVRYCEDDKHISNDGRSNGFGIQCRMISGNPVIRDEINRCAEVFKTVCSEAEKLLVATARKNSVTTFFSFPPAVRTACEQYLLYFVQFLEDLGIKADAEIKEDARRVLFSVTPTDEKVALEQVRQALETYLKLPDMPDFGATASQYPNLAVQQLQGNILHLQSQLTLARASLQVQEATIEALQLSNYQYRQLLSSAEKPKEKSADEPLIGDTVHVTKIEGKGVKVDLPLILKRLKRVLGIGAKRIE
jgi:hypothetical protein